MIGAPHVPLPLGDIVVGARFLASLRGYLRHPLTLDEARSIIEQRLRQREADFLAGVRRAIYGQPTSPYCHLLHLIGCTYGDLERLVSQEGLEGTLGILYRQGVYLTVDEFKGRRPAVRGSATIEVGPDLLRNPFSAFHLPIHTGGSRGSATPVMLDLAFIRDNAVNSSLVLEAHGGSAWQKAVFMVPGGAALYRLLEHSSYGAPATRWFSQVDPAAPGLHPRYRWSARAMRWGSILAGVPLPSGLHVSLENPLPIVRWMASVLRGGQTPYLFTFPSSAVRVCEAAFEAGIDLRGAQCTITGEPVTEARLATIRRAGAEADPRYAAIETGSIGFGCLARQHADDVHLQTDFHAMIQDGEEGAAFGLPANALLITSLRPTAPFIMLNFSMGDQAIMEQRSCGCALEQLGWATHLHAIRSYEKLTAGGMTFLATDVIRVLEVVLPERFGGGPTDYQLREEESADGRPHLSLLVHPSLGPLDEADVVDTFLSAVGHGSGAERVMELMWRDAGVLQVVRREPQPTVAGKILHLQAGRPGPAT